MFMKMYPPEHFQELQKLFPPKYLLDVRQESGNASETPGLFKIKSKKLKSLRCVEKLTLSLFG